MKPALTPLPLPEGMEAERVNHLFRIVIFQAQSGHRSAGEKVEALADEEEAGEKFIRLNGLSRG